MSRRLSGGLSYEDCMHLEIGLTAYQNGETARALGHLAAIGEDAWAFLLVRFPDLLGILPTPAPQAQAQ